MSQNVERFGYHGTGGALFMLLLKNALLTIVTLGIYSFWAKNNVRVFHYQNTEIYGERFSWLGKGGELLRGALLAGGIMLVLGLAATLFTRVLAGDTPSPMMMVLFNLVAYAVFGVLIVAAMHGARRYRLSRSAYRGIRFSYHADLGEFYALMIKGTLLSIVTLGLYLPFFANQRRAFFAQAALFGTETFHYDGDGRELFGAFGRALLLTIPTLGICWLWYKAFQHRYFWKHTTMRSVRFISSVTGGELFKLHALNVLLAICTIGIATPWIIVRTRRFYSENLVQVGDVDWETIRQRTQESTAVSEGLLETFDVDVGFGT